MNARTVGDLAQRLLPKPKGILRGESGEKASPPRQRNIITIPTDFMGTMRSFQLSDPLQSRPPAVQKSVPLDSLTPLSSRRSEIRIIKKFKGEDDYSYSIFDFVPKK